VCPALTDWEDGPLASCPQVQSWAAPRTPKLLRVPSSLLRGCSRLSRVDTSGLHGVREVGDQCFSTCPSLTSIDLAGLANVTSIGANFASENSSLTALDTSCLTALTSVGPRFCSGCVAMHTLDARGLVRIAAEPLFFFGDCRSLRAIDTGGIANAGAVDALLRLLDSSATPPRVADREKTTRNGSQTQPVAPAATGRVVGAGQYVLHLGPA